MALFSSFKREEPMDEGPPKWPLDLVRFRIGPHGLGEAPDTGSLWGRLMQTHAVGRPEGSGVEIGLVDGQIDSVFVEMEDFRGGFLRDGEACDLGPDSTVAAMQQLFGEPYWTDRSDGEVILFYEFRGGGVELQFEFPDGERLGFVTLSRNGVMSDAAQRAAYGCDRPWPPES